MEGRGLLVICLFLVVASVKSDLINLSCPEGVLAFSSSVSTRHYYSCRNKDLQPVLAECPDGLIYHTRLQECVEPEMLDKPQRGDIVALGRNFVLGSLYDERTQQFFPEASFWTRATVKDAMYDSPSSDFVSQVYTDQTISERMDTMNIEAEIEMNFCSGSIHVAGMAGFYKDEVTSASEVNTQMYYKTTLKDWSMSTHTPMDFPGECDYPDKYTHVVTGITMGAEVVFNFKRQVAEGETFSNISGILEVAIGKIPNLDINGEGSVDIEEKEKSVLEKTILRMHGDFSPESALPSNFVQAVDFYKSLSSMLQNEDDLSIVNAYLTPITSVCNGVDVVINNLNGALVDNINRMLDELQLLNMKVGELMALSPVKLFKSLRENLNTFHVGLKTYTLGKKSQLQKVLPLVKNGTAGAEDDLSDIYGEYTKNQTYNTLFASDYLAFRAREINAIAQLLARFPPEDNIALADYESANDVQYVFEKDMVTILEFNVVAPLSLTLDFMEDGTLVDDDQYWYNDIDWAGDIGSILRHTHEFAMDNVGQSDRGYLLMISPFDEVTPYTFNALVKGKLVSDHFVAPRSPALPQEVVDITHQSFSFNIKKSSEFTIGCRVIMTDVAGNLTREADIMFPEEALINQNTLVTVDKVRSATAYTFMVKYITAVGTSPPSLKVNNFNTAPTSSPYGLSVKDVTDHSLTLTWIAPEFFAPGVDEGSIQYTVRTTWDDGTEESDVSTNELQLPSLMDGTRYQFEVSAVVKGLHVEGMNHPEEASVPASFTAYTAPLRPSGFAVTEVDTHSLLLNWEAPTKLGPGAQVIHYEVNYMHADSPRWLIVNDTQVRVMDLAQDTTYEFSVKVVTSKSMSAFTSAFPIKTLFRQTSMDKLRDDLYGAMSEVSTAIKKQSRFCASQLATNQQGVLTYTNTMTNVNTVDGASMDSGSGVFTAGAAGSYQVTINMRIRNGGNQVHEVWILKNGQKVSESKISTSFGSNTGIWIDNASRDLILFLEAGENVSVTHETDGNEGLENVTFCMSSLSFNQ